MERLMVRLNSAKNALSKFKEALEMPKNKISRDVTLLRFQFTTEAIWKLAQHYLREKEGVEATSPKSTVRNSLQQSLLLEQEAHSLLEVVDDRNLIVHTYNEILAEQLYNKMPLYYQLLEKWFMALENKL